MNLSLQRSMAVTLVASALILTACTNPNPVNNAQRGAIAGAVLGGVVGNQFGEGSGRTAATVLGTVLGSYIGGQYGARFDAIDQQYLNQALYSGRPASWQNSSTGYSYHVVPGQAYQSYYNNQALTCRPVTIAANIDGRPQNVQMRACQNVNGQWYSAS